MMDFSLKTFEMWSSDDVLQTVGFSPGRRMLDFAESGRLFGNLVVTTMFLENDVVNYIS